MNLNMNLNQVENKEGSMIQGQGGNMNQTMISTTSKAILNQSFDSNNKAVEALANVVLNSGNKFNAVTKAIDALVDAAFPQKAVADKFREDLPATSWDKMMKLVLYTLFAAGGGVQFPEEVIDNTFVVADERMIPELAFYEFIGQRANKKFSTNDSDKVERKLVNFLAELYGDEGFKSVKKFSKIKQDLGERIKVVDLDRDDPVKHTGGAITETIEVLKFFLDGKNTDLPVLVSRACQDVLDELADEYPALAEKFNLELVVAHPNDVRHFYSGVGIEELTFISKVFSGLNPSNKDTPLELINDGEGYHRLVFDGDEDKTIFIEPRGGGCNGHTVRLANGNYIQPVKIVTAAGQVGQVPKDDQVELDAVGSLIYYLSTYAITTVGGRSEIDSNRNSNKDNKGSSQVGEDIYRAIEAACENEDPEYLLCSGSPRDDVQRFYFSELINWFAGTHFRCQNGKLKFFNTLKGDKIRSRLNILRKNLGEFGTTSDVKVEEVDKSQVIENLVNQNQILSTKNNTCLHGETMMLKGSELTYDECKSLLVSLSNKGKKALFNRRAKDQGYDNPKQYIKDNGGEEVVLDELSRNRADIIFLFSDKGGNKAIDRIRNLFALVEKLHPVTEAPVGYQFPKTAFSINTGVAIKAAKTSQLLAFGDGTGLSMPLANGTKSPIIAMGEKQSTHDFNVSESFNVSSMQDLASILDLTVSGNDEDGDESYYEVYYDFYVDKKANVTSPMPIGKGDKVCSVVTSDVAHDVIATEDGYVTAIKVYLTEDFGSPRIRIKVSYRTAETAWKARGPIKATWIDTNLSGRRDLLRLNESEGDELEAEYVITQSENKSLDIGFNGLPEFGCTLANNLERYDQLRDSAKKVADKMQELAADFNCKAGHAGVNDRVVLDRHAVAKGYHKPLIKFLNDTFGQAVWYTPEQHEEITEGLYKTFTEGRGEEQRYQEISVQELSDEGRLPSELKEKQDLRVFMAADEEKDINDPEAWIVAFYHEGGRLVFAQRCFTWVGTLDTGEFYLPTGVEKSTVKDAVGLTNFTPTVVRNVARLSQELAEEMLIENPRKRQVFNILSACYRANQALSLGELVGYDQNRNLLRVSDVGKDPSLQNIVEEKLLDEDEEGELFFNSDSIRTLLEDLAQDQDSDIIFALPDDKGGHAYVNLVAVNEVDASKTDEATNGLGGLVKEYLINLVSQETDVNNSFMRWLAGKIKSMLNAYVEGTSFQKLPFKADSAFNCRPVVGPDCATEEVHMLVCEDSDSAWQTWLKHLRHRRSNLEAAGKHEAAKRIERYIRGDLHVAFAFANRNPLAYSPFIKVHPVVENEEGRQFKLEEDGSWTELSYLCGKYQFKASHWLYLATRGDADGDLLALYWADHHADDIGVTTWNDVVDSLQESTGVDPVRDLDKSDYWTDYTDVKSSQDEQEITGIAGNFQDDFCIESIRTTKQWSTGVGLTYAMWNYQQTMLDILDIDDGSYRRILSNDLFDSVRREDDTPELDTVSAEAYELQLSNYEPDAYVFSYKTLPKLMNNPYAKEPLFREIFKGLGVNVKYHQAYYESTALYAWGRAIFDGKSMKDQGGNWFEMTVDKACEGNKFNKVEIMLNLLGIFAQMGQQAKLKLGDFKTKRKTFKERVDLFGQVPAHVKALDFVRANCRPGSGAENEVEAPGLIEALRNQSFSFRWLTGIVEDTTDAMAGRAPTIDWSVFGKGTDEDSENDPQDPDQDPDQGQNPDEESGGEDDMKDLSDIIEGLNEEQARAVQNIKEKKNTRILGEGGTGKSFTFDACRRAAERLGHRVLDSAANGNAADASNCRYGTTNLMLGLKLGTDSFVPKGVQPEQENDSRARESVANIAGNKTVKSRFATRRPIWVFIDEAETMSAEELFLVYQVVQEVAKNKEVYFLLAGDPGQLPQVEGNRSFQKPVFNLTSREGVGGASTYLKQLGYEYDSESHTLTAPSPHRLMKLETIYLHQKIRQSDAQFGYDLMLARFGHMGPTIWSRFDASFNEKAPDTAINFHHRNLRVREDKNKRLLKRKEEGYPTETFYAHITVFSEYVLIGEQKKDPAVDEVTKNKAWGEFKFPVKNGDKPLFVEFKDLNVVKDVREELVMELYKGETMFITHNLRPSDVSNLKYGEEAMEQVYVAGNGSTVIVEDFLYSKDGKPAGVRVRKTLDGTSFDLRRIEVHHHNKKFMRYKQLPLAPAEAAITTHRSQGRTELRPVVVHPSQAQYNEAYVQLSRAQTADQLWFDTCGGNRKKAFTRLESAIANIDEEALDHCQSLDKKYLVSNGNEAIHLIPESSTWDEEGDLSAWFIITTKPTSAKAPKQFQHIAVLDGGHLTNRRYDNAVCLNGVDVDNDGNFVSEQYEMSETNQSRYQAMLEAVYEWLEDRGRFDSSENDGDEPDGDEPDGDEPDNGLENPVKEEQVEVEAKASDIDPNQDDNPVEPYENSEQPAQVDLSAMNADELLKYGNTLEGEQQLLKAHDLRETYKHKAIGLAQEIIEWSNRQMDDIIKVQNWMYRIQLEYGEDSESALEMATDLISVLFSATEIEPGVFTDRFYTALATKFTGIEVPGIGYGIYSDFIRRWESGNFYFHNKTSDPSCYPLGVEFGYANHFKDLWTKELQDWSPTSAKEAVEVFKAISLIWKFTLYWDVPSLIEWHLNYGASDDAKWVKDLFKEPEAESEAPAQDDYNESETKSEPEVNMLSDYSDLELLKETWARLQGKSDRVDQLLGELHRELTEPKQEETKDQEQESEYEGAWHFYTDGSCNNNSTKDPNAVGGWAVVVYSGNKQVDSFGDREFSDKIQVTSNRCEAKAILKALEKAQSLDGEEVHIYSDSKYCVNCVTSYIWKWRKQNWTKKGGEQPKNLDLWKQICSYLLEFGDRVVFHSVKAHSDEIAEMVTCEGNVEADKLAQKYMREAEAIINKG